MSLTALQCPSCAHVFRVAEELLHPASGKAVAATCPQCQHKTDASRFVEEYIQQEAKDRAAALEREIKQKQHDRKWHARLIKKVDDRMYERSVEKEAVRREKLRQRQQRQTLNSPESVVGGLVFCGWAFFLIAALILLGIVISAHETSLSAISFISCVISGIFFLALGHMLGSLERLGKKIDLTNHYLRSRFEADNQKGDYEHPERDDN